MRDREETFVLPTETSIWQRPIPVAAIILLALAIHGPLLVMQLPATTSYDANLHIFFASHYAHHWFNPWNEKWFGGFSQTTYPPLTHQWIALLSYIVGLTEASCWCSWPLSSCWRWARTGSRSFGWMTVQPAMPGCWPCSPAASHFLSIRRGSCPPHCRRLCIFWLCLISIRGAYRPAGDRS
jgi:hypothetical protein